MDSIQALAKVYDSLSKGASTLDFLPSDITGDCAAQVQEVVRERISGKVTEKAIPVRAYEKALKDLEKLGNVQGVLFFALATMQITRTFPYYEIHK